MKPHDLFIRHDDVFYGFTFSGYQWITDQYCCWRADRVDAAMFLVADAWEDAAEAGDAISLLLEKDDFPDADEWPTYQFRAVGISLRGRGTWPPPSLIETLTTTGVELQPSPWSLREEARLDGVSAWTAPDWTSWVNSRLTATLMNRTSYRFDQRAEFFGIRVLNGDEVIGAVMPSLLDRVPPLPKLRGGR